MTEDIELERIKKQIAIEEAKARYNELRMKNENFEENSQNVLYPRTTLDWSSHLEQQNVLYPRTTLDWSSHLEQKQCNHVEPKAELNKRPACKDAYNNVVRENQFKTRNDMLQITDFGKFTGHAVDFGDEEVFHTDCMFENHMGAYFFDHNTSEILVTQFGTPKAWQDLIRKKNRAPPVKYQRLRSLLKEKGAKVFNTITLYDLDNLISLVKDSIVEGEALLKKTDAEATAAIESYNGDSAKLIDILYCPNAKALLKGQPFEKEIKNLKPFSPKKQLAYLRNVKKFFSDTIKKRPTDVDASEIFADLTDHELITPTELQLMCKKRMFGLQKGETGGALYTHAYKLSSALRALSIVYDIKDSTLIPYLDEVQTTARTFTTPGSSKIPLELKINEARCKKEIHMEIEKIAFPNESAFQQMVKDAPFDFHIVQKKDLDIKPKEKDETQFFKRMQTGDFYKCLANLWAVRERMKAKTDSLQDFTAFLGTKEGLIWIKYDLCCVRLRHMYGRERETFSELPLIGDFSHQSVDWLIDELKNKERYAQAKWMQLILPALVAKWWSPRETILGNIKVMSETDYAHLQVKHGLWQLSHGLFIIVKEDGYRIIKSEHKTKAHAGEIVSPDFDLEGPQLEQYHRLSELLPTIHLSFDILTNSAVTHNSVQQNTYTSSYSPENDPQYRGKHLVLQYHSFPLRYPVFENGSKDFLQPQIEYSYDDIWVHESNRTIMGEHYKPGKVYKPSFHAKTLKYLETQQMTVTKGDRKYVVPVCPTPNTNTPLVEQYVQRALKNKTPEMIKKTFGGRESGGKEIIGDINTILRDAGKNYYHFEGRDYKCDMSDHVRICSKKAVVNYRSLGRYHEGDQMNVVYKAIGELEIPGLTKEYDDKRTKKKKKENHHSDRIFVEAYKAVKNDKDLYNFSTLGPEYNAYNVRRLAAGKERPSFDKKPTAHALDTTPNDGSRKSRLHDDRFLSLQEQQIQHRWRVTYYKKYQWLKKYQTQYVGADTAIKKMEALMKKAQALWDPPSLLARTFSIGKEAVEKCLPKRKREDEAGPSKKRDRPE